MKRILLVSAHLSKGGGQRVISWLTKEWSAEHDVIVCVFEQLNDPFPVGGFVLDLNLPSRKSWAAKPLQALRRVWALADVIRKTSPDVMIGFMESASIPLVVAAIVTGTTSKLTVSVHNNPSTSPKYLRYVMQMLYRYAARVITVSAGVRDQIATELKIPPDRLQVVYNPVDVSEVQRRSREEVAFPPQVSEPFVLGAGRLVWEKDFTRMLRVFSNLSDETHRLIIAGEGPMEAELRARIEELKLHDRVYLLGWVENPFALMKHASAFLLTSSSEGFGNVLVEAMACGCPVVAFDCNHGPGEIIQDGYSGILIPGSDEGEFSSRLRELLGDVQMQQRYRQAGLDRAMYFDVKDVADQWLKPGTPGVRNGHEFLLRRAKE